MPFQPPNQQRQSTEGKFPNQLTASILTEADMLSDNHETFANYQTH